MGFGANLFFAFVLLPASVILLLVSVVFRKKQLSLFLVFSWAIICIFITGVSMLQWVFSKTDVDQDRIYGSYVIDRDQFPGKQADWQYNHFWFEIKEDNFIYFHITDGKSVVKTIKGRVSFNNDDYISSRLRIHLGKQDHHILSNSPTLYRNYWSYYYVFSGTDFQNVFFKPGKWKPTD